MSVFINVTINIYNEFSTDSDLQSLSEGDKNQFILFLSVFVTDKGLDYVG